MSWSPIGDRVRPRASAGVAGDRVTEADARRAEADARQAELDRLNATLKRLEAQVAATRGNLRGETAPSPRRRKRTLEKAKLDQDVLIDGLRETLKKLPRRPRCTTRRKPRRRRRLWLVRRYLKRMRWMR